MPSPTAARTSSRPTGAASLVANADHFDRVVINGILTARTSVDIMTADFKAMLVPDKGPSRRAESIIHHLRQLADRGVEIRLLHAGTPSSPALRELKQELPRNLTIRRCPRLHAKAVIIDARQMYLGSANLTGAGLGAKNPHKRNFELGLWTTSADLIDATLDHFNTLWQGHHCETCQLHHVCPTPLEEPEL